MLNVLYWFAVAVVGVVVSAAILLQSYSPTVEKVFAVAIVGGIAFSIFRGIAYIFYYVVAGDKAVALWSKDDKKDKFYLINPLVLSVFTIAIFAGLVSAVIIFKPDDSLSEPSSFDFEETSFRQTVSLGSTPTFSENLGFSALELLNLGTIVSDDFGYNSYYPKTTDGTFIKASFTITNNGLSDTWISIKDINLVDDQGRNFNSDKFFTCSNPFGRLGSTPNLGGVSLKPGIPCRVSVLFESSATSKAFNINFIYDGL